MMQVLHSCDNPPCVNPDHLFIGTNLQNRQDSVAKNRQAKGENITASKLTATDIEQIRVMWNSGRMSQVEIGRLFNVAGSNICRIVSGDGWKHVPKPPSP